MSKPLSFDKPEVNLFASEEGAGGAPSPDTPFRLAVLGDFGGCARPAAGAAPRPVEIDRDNFDEVMRGLGVELCLPLAGGRSLTLRFDVLDDFHPDRIYERLDHFKRLRQTRARLGDPSTFASAAAEVLDGGLASSAAGRVQEPEGSPGPASEASARDLVEQMLGGGLKADPSPARPAEPSEFNQFLRDIVRPHLVSFDEARQSELVGAVDAAAQELMRALLHHPDFQALEAAWRALHFLASRAETGASLKLYLVDITREELAAGLGAPDAGRRGALYGLFVEESAGTPGGEPWALVAGNYTFGQTREDARLLRGVAEVARAAGAPFVAAASTRLLGCESLAETPNPEEWQEPDGGEDAEAWRDLRAHALARNVGLALPRFLLRLPYGADTEPAESFAFEEFEAGEPPHEEYLWGNPAFACALLLAEAFDRSGWEMRAGECREVEGLPLHVYDAGGESRIKPCAEVSLTERAAEEMLGRGVMPLLSRKGGDGVALARFQSLATPLAPLAGRWS
jgi:type VI secretion system protein ImpC